MNQTVSQCVLKVVCTALLMVASASVSANAVNQATQDQVQNQIQDPIKFKQNIVSAGFYSKGFFNPDFPRPPSPIFWSASLKMHSGVMLQYEHLLYHTSKHFSLYLGGSWSRWRRAPETVYATSVYLAMRFWLLNHPSYGLYVNYSVAGPTILSQDHLAGKSLGGSFIFQDYMGLGMRIGQAHPVMLNVNLLHYSNGDLFTKNPGFDVPVVLSVGYAF